MEIDIFLYLNTIKHVKEVVCMAKAKYAGREAAQAAKKENEAAVADRKNKKEIRQEFEVKKSTQ